MQTSGLLFIPDISGFTRFVKAVEIEHSRLIIQELLEILIDANESDLTISEIEGDAILFYKFGERPSLNDIYRQVEKMFIAFHKTLISYEKRKYCQCSACLTAINLTLKVITHYGEFTEYNVKTYNKLIGKDIIVAHQLLKNDIEQHEYWLVTSGLLGEGNVPAVKEEIKWNSSHKSTEEGDLFFHYAALGFLKNNIHVEPFEKPDLSLMKNIFRLTHDFDTDIISLLHLTADYRYRDRWMEGVKEVEIQNHILPRIGMRSILTFADGRRSVRIAKHYCFTENTIEFSELDEASGALSLYQLGKISELRTRLTFDHYIPDNPLAVLKYKLSKRKSVMTMMERSFKHLTELVTETGDAIRIKLQPIPED